MKIKIIILFATMALACLNIVAATVGTEFIYQGRLTDGNGTASGTYDFTFTLHLASSGGVPIVTVTNLNTPVSNGVFTTSVDFGGGIYNGNAYWISLGVRSNGTAVAFTALTPRQPLSPTPNASYASLAGTVPGGSINSSKLAVDAVTSAAIQNNAVTGAKIGSGQVVKTVNGLHDDVVFAAGANMTLTPIGNTLTFQGSTDWKLAGNSGTTPGTDFVGTVDNTSLLLKVNNAPAFRIDPAANGPNMVGGLSAIRPTVITAGVRGAVVAGGGAPAGPVNGFGGGDFQAIYDSDGTIGGGFGNKVGNNNADVNDAPFGTVAGGVFNGAAGYASTVGGGDGNFAAGIRSTIAGGAGNQALSQDSFVGGGGANIILGNSQGALIGGGSGNTIQTNATNSSILAGLNNLIEAKSVSSTINAGTRNRIRLGFFGTISCTIGGGEANVIDTVDARYATIAGGYGNTNNDVGATIGGGYGNTANGAEATVAGGYGNIASQGQSTVGGGFQNTSIGSAATVAGGGNNTSSGNNATVGGGGLNKSTADGATVAGGANGVSSAVYATVGGGDFNIASGTGATVPGGNDNRAAGRNSFAAGQGARANHDGSFVWTDSQFIIGGFGSSGPDQFIVRARGGSRFFGGDLWDVNNTEGDFRIGTDAYRFKIGVAQGGGGAGDVWMRPHGGTGRVILKTPGGTIIYSNEGQTAGVSLAAGGGGWTTVSDRNAKEHFAKVNGRDVLDKVVSMPVQSWNYKAQASSIRHIGVMAQDFYAAFHVGETNIGITTVDADGVALAAIQGLNEKLDERDAEIQNLKEKNSSLEAKFNELAATVRALAGKK